MTCIATKIKNPLLNRLFDTSIKTYLIQQINYQISEFNRFCVQNPNLTLQQIWQLKADYLDLLKRNIFKLQQAMAQSSDSFLFDAKEKIANQLQACLYEIREVEIGLQNTALLKLAPNQNTSNISDDLRVCVYDWLKISYADNVQVLDAIIAPIHQKTFAPICQPSQLACQKEQLNAFIQKQEKAITQQHNPSEAKSVFWYLKWLSVQTALVVANYVGVFSIFAFSPILTNLTFYGIVLLPTWVLTYQALALVRNYAYDWLSYPAKKKQWHALDTLSAVQHFIHTELSQAIVDIPRFDLEHQQVRVNACLNKLNQIKNSLPNMAAQCDTQIAIIKAFQSRIAQNMTKRLPWYIKQMVKHSVDANMVPLLTRQRVKQIQSFVISHGSTQTIADFDLGAQLYHAFFKALARNKCQVAPAHTASWQVPWGHNQISFPALRGWSRLIQTLDEERPQKHAACELIRVLKGEQNISLDNLQHIISTIMPLQRSEMLVAVQKHIFDCLTDYPTHYAQLLSQHQKNELNKWQACNENLINSAKICIQKGLTEQGPHCDYIASIHNQKLAMYQQALVGEQYANAAMGQQSEDAYQPVRQYIVNYKGHDPKALYLIRLLPLNDRATSIGQLARKRLEWLLQHPCIELSQTDIALFYHPLLEEAKADFDFSMQLNIFMQNFDNQDKSVQILMAFAQSGLVDQNTVEHYVKGAPRV